MHFSPAIFLKSFSKGTNQKRTDKQDTQVQLADISDKAMVHVIGKKKHFFKKRQPKKTLAGQTQQTPTFM